ncbi:unnamed protein product, partial [Mesorhabditis spiculigera]
MTSKQFEMQIRFSDHESFIPRSNLDNRGAVNTWLVGIALSLLVYCFAATFYVYLLSGEANEKCHSHLSAKSRRECPKDWIPAAEFSKCYKPVETSETHAFAKLACQRDGAELLTLGSSAESDFVGNLPFRDGTVKDQDGFWLGPTFEGTLHELVGPRGETALFENVAPDGRNGSGVNERCVILRGKKWANTWFSISCTQTTYFICEIRLDKY